LEGQTSRHVWKRIVVVDVIASGGGGGGGIPLVLVLEATLQLLARLHGTTVDDHGVFKRLIKKIIKKNTI